MLLFFLFTVTASTEFYTLSLHDALPIYGRSADQRGAAGAGRRPGATVGRRRRPSACHARGPGGDRLSHQAVRSEEHTSELQSHSDLVCRLLLEKKKRMIRHTFKLCRTHF